MSLQKRKSKVHFIGIGGIGMSGLAELLLKLGHSVSGSDANESDITKRLTKLGASINIGHNSAFIEKCTPDVVVYSSAISSQNPEIVFAKQKNIPIIQRAEMLSELMRLKRGIAVAGSHGKTTSTGFVSLLLKAAGLDPTVIIGGRFDAIGSNAAWGEGEWLVAEADESDGSFLRLTPEICIVTNIDHEHLDHYHDFESVKRAFLHFIDQIPFYGRAILCSDCPHLSSLASSINKPVYWYGIDESKKPDFLIKPLLKSKQFQFEVYRKKDGYASAWIKLALSVPGTHNMLNATAAAIAAFELSVNTSIIQEALNAFRGVRRRFESVGVWNECPVIEDYAHHPTEIKVTIEAARGVFPNHKPYVLFQPHRYSRTRDLWAQFATCFEGAEAVFTLPIYSASEQRDEWTKSYDAENFAANISNAPAHYCLNTEALTKVLEEAVQNKKLTPGTPILILGAGDLAGKMKKGLNLSGTS